MTLTVHARSPAPAILAGRRRRCRASNCPAGRDRGRPARASSRRCGVPAPGGDCSRKSAVAVNDEFADDDRTSSQPADEVALHPARQRRVSGILRVMIRLTREPIDYHALTEPVRDPHCGAVVLFLGTVRDLTGEQVTVVLDYEAYPADGREEDGRDRGRGPRAAGRSATIAMVHRLGRLEVGEVSVAVAVSCPHRGRGVRGLPLRHRPLKELVPIWKKENWAGRNRGVGPPAAKARTAEDGQA